MKTEPPFDHYLNNEGPKSEDYIKGYIAGYKAAKKYYKSGSSWEGCVDTASGAFTDLEKENAIKW